MISTSERRKMFPRRYIRKDARNRCLGLAFGFMKENAAHLWTGVRVLHPLSEIDRVTFAESLRLTDWPQERIEQVSRAFNQRIGA